MDFWTTLIEELRHIGFSSIQIDKLRDQFGNSDAVELLNTPEQEFLPHMTGRSRREKQEKIAALLAVVEEVQVRLDRQSRRGEIVTINGELKGLPQDVLWQGLTVGLVDLKRSPRQTLWRTAVEEGSKFTFQVSKSDWRRLSPTNEPRFRFMLFWNGRSLYSTREPIALAADPSASPIDIDVPPVAISRLQAMAAPQKLRRELDVDAIAKAANVAAAVQTQLRQANIQTFDDLFSTAGRTALENLDLGRAQTRQLYTTARWAAYSGDIDLVSKVVAIGIDSSDRLARTPLPELERRLDLDLTPEEREGIGGLILLAQAESNLLKDANSEKPSGWLDRFKAPDSIIAPDQDDDDDPAVQLCADCDECATVFSPLAYAYDLVTFIEDTWGVDPQAIEDLILQDIDLDCARAQAPVQQIVLAIEVLERYLQDERQVPLSGIGQWPERYREFANAILRALHLDPALGTVRRHQQDLYAAARETAPTMATILLLVDLARGYFESYVAPERAGDPERPAGGDDEAYAAYLAQRTQAETQRQQLQHRFTQQLESLIAPLLVEYRARLIEAATVEVANLEQRLFIDLQTAACQKTSRITQIIQSLHSFVLSVRTHAIRDNDRAIVIAARIDSTRFDETSWNWLQTYSAWSAAMYAFVYPDNLLSPYLQRSRMTSTYLRALQALSGGSVTAELLDDIDESYSQLFQDTASLRVCGTHVVGTDLFVFAYVETKSTDDDAAYRLWFIRLSTAALAEEPDGNASLSSEVGNWVEIIDWPSDLMPRTVVPFGRSENLAFMALGYTKSEGHSLDHYKTYRMNAQGLDVGEVLIDSEHPGQDAASDSASTYVTLSVLSPFSDTPTLWTSIRVEDHGDISHHYYAATLNMESYTWNRWSLYIGTQDGQLAPGKPWFIWGDSIVNETVCRARRVGSVIVIPNHSFPAEYALEPIPGVNSIKEVEIDADSSVLIAWNRDTDESYLVITEPDGRIQVRRISVYTDAWDLSFQKTINIPLIDFITQDKWPAVGSKSLEPASPAAHHIAVIERYLHVPLLAGWALNQAGDYAAAHDWYRRLYDPYAEEPQIFPFEEYFHGSIQRSDIWLQSIEDPHAVASRRGNTYLRHVVLMMTKNLLDWADQEFILDTVESRNRARQLYQMAARILQAPEMRNPCSTGLRALEFDVARRLTVTASPSAPEPSISPTVAFLIEQALDELRTLTYNKAVLQAIEQIEDLLEQDLLLSAFEARLRRIVEEAITLDKAQAGPLQSLKKSLQDGKAKREQREERLVPGWFELATSVQAARAQSVRIASATELFCIPHNPLLQSYQSRIDAALALLRNCLDINGEPVPTGLRSGVQGRTITTFGQLTSQTAAATEPPHYRYSFLIERARQHAALAQQLESLMLAAIERRDSAALAILEAEIAEEVAGATVALRNLSLDQAQQAVDVASLQSASAATILDFWEGRVGDGTSFMGVGGLNEAEMSGLALMGTSGVLQGAAAVGYLALAYPAASVAFTGSFISTAGALGGTATAPTSVGAATGAAVTAAGAVAMMAGIVAGGNTFLSGVQAAAGAAGTFGSLALTWASFERRWEEWQHQHELANIGKQLADAQLLDAQSGVAIAELETEIADLSQGHSSLVLDFHRNRFSNEPLYQWMIGVLQDAYRSVMQNATATAKLAQRALEFEQQQPITFVQGDYWSIDAAALTEEQRASGLLGAERLLSDMSRLDEWKLRTDRRRLELSKTISLAQMAPSDFMRFRETGAMNFNTLMDWFDWDFPGHYLRLIKSVRVSMIALVPPIDGIHATLANSGHSRIVVPQDGTFVEVDALRRFPEAVALDSPTNDSGLFVLDYKDPMLLPFEGLGVETGWRLELPKASNRLNFDSLVDVYFTVEYTAFQNTAYRDQVIARLGSRRNSDLIISLRSNYPDQWYDLHNPEDETAGQTLTIDLPPYTFPAAASDELGIRQLMVLLLGPSGKARSGAFKLQRVGYAPSFTVNTDENGAFSTRNGVKVDGDDIPHSPFAIDPNNSTNLLPAPASGDIALLDPRGEWQMTFGPEWYDAAGSAQAIDGLHDIILIPTVEYEANWPS